MKGFEGQTSYNKNVLYCQLFWYVCRHFYMVYVSTHWSIWHHFIINKIWFAVILHFFIHNPLSLKISLGNERQILAQAQEEHRCIIGLILVLREDQSKWRGKKGNQAGGGRKTRRALEREKACWREPVIAECGLENRKGEPRKESGLAEVTKALGSYSGWASSILHSRILCCWWLNLSVHRAWVGRIELSYWG